jgi:hypothetical protein
MTEDSKQGNTLQKLQGGGIFAMSDIPLKDANACYFNYQRVNRCKMT